MVKEALPRRTLVLDAGLDRLQAFLLNMAPGEEVSLDAAVRISGLSVAICTRVLEALTRAGLLTQAEHGAYIRRGVESSELQPL